MKYAEWRPHPWHGLEAGRELQQVYGAGHAARVVAAAVEDYKVLLQS